MKKIVSTLIFMFFFSLTFAEQAQMNDRIAIDLKGIPIQDALHLLANELHQDILISPTIHGMTSLHLHDMTPRQAFDFVITSHGLIRYEQHHVWFIVPQAEFMQYKQNELKLQEMVLQTEPLVSRIWQIRYANAEDVAHVIQDEGHSLLSKRGYLHVDVRTNQLCVQDIQKNIMVIYRLIKQIDIPVKQVVIEARLASVDNDFERQLGIHFSVQTTSGQNGGPMNFSETSASHYSIAVATLADGSLLDMQLAALENSGHGELISSPSLFTANRETASIESGEEIPYQEISSSGATGVAFKKAVLSLKVSPHVLPNNHVLLQLQINQDRPSNRIVQGVPAITTRQITTNVLAKNGQTIVLGGIYESNNGDTSESVPFLNKIPIVGLLFQSHDRVENKRELLIFVTPKIIN